jgi:hypothetical protein
MNNRDIETKIISDDEFGDGDTRSTPLIITTGRKLKSSVEIGINIAHKGGLLMLLVAIVSLSKMIGLKVSKILAFQEIMTL